jgi:hypothetical protein
MRMFGWVVMAAVAVEGLHRDGVDPAAVGPVEVALQCPPTGEKIAVDSQQGVNAIVTTGGNAGAGISTHRDPASGLVSVM